MNSLEVVSLGYVASRFNTDPQRLLATLLALGYRPTLTINGLQMFGTEAAHHAVRLIQSGEPLPTIHGPPTTPVEFSDADDGDGGDDGEPEAPGDIPPSLIRSSDISELTGRN